MKQESKIREFLNLFSYANDDAKKKETINYIISVLSKVWRSRTESTVFIEDKESVLDNRFVLKGKSKDFGKSSKTL